MHPDLSMPYRPTARVLHIRQQVEAATRAEVAAAKAAQMREQADAVEQVGDVPSILQSVTTAQLEESTLRDEIARWAAVELHDTSLDVLPRERQADLRRGAAFLMRQPHAAWRAEAHKTAQPVIAQLLREELGLSPEAAALLSVRCVSYAVTAYNSVLDGTTCIAPGRYLRVLAAIAEQEQ